MARKILIVQTILAHYRQSLFEILVSANERQVTILSGGDDISIKQIEESASNILVRLTNLKFRILGHTYIWQRGIIKFLKENKPDVIVLPGVDPHVLSSLYISLICKLIYRCKVIWWGHNDLRRRKNIGFLFRRFFLNLGDGIFTYSSADQDFLRRILHVKNVFALKNCLNVSDYGFNLIRDLDKRPASTKLNIIFSGRVTREKRLDVLINALHDLRCHNIDFDCTIIGDGVALEEAIRKVKTLGLTEYVDIVGEVYDEKCLPYFERADLLVLPGKVGLSIVHALSYGLPVITSNLTEIHSPEYEIINRGLNGDFYDQFDSKSLALKIVEWRNRVVSDAENVRHACVKSVLDSGYTPQSMSNKIFEGINAVLNDK